MGVDPPRCPGRPRGLGTARPDRPSTSSPRRRATTRFGRIGPRRWEDSSRGSARSRGASAQLAASTRRPRPDGTAAVPDLGRPAGRAGTTTGRRRRAAHATFAPTYAPSTRADVGGRRAAGHAAGRKKVVDGRRDRARQANPRRDEGRHARPRADERCPRDGDETRVQLHGVGLWPSRMCAPSWTRRRLGQAL